ncbi:hypothetical protein HX021_16415 [Sphingobacterium sp. N143]|uniref:helix-turn-helix domain-containing protein n=1 Tax=Sphingobacterium sp. N143 TaxID=2746727 RepID=UPI002575572D|nr:helix-turn-helix domain-containing protein [Sphingobacterium sp. N143]MDM1295875.1 hypothetical protein [Sphingobacterium sp. N143]
MFFAIGSPDLQGIIPRFVSNASGNKIQISYSLRTAPSHSDPMINTKLDRILDLLQDQQYSDLNKLIGTMTIKEVASYLSKSVRTIERRIERGLLKAVGKVGNADLYGKKDVVQLYIAEYKKWPKRMP